MLFFDGREVVPFDARYEAPPLRVQDGWPDAPLLDSCKGHPAAGEHLAGPGS
jgi:hypothetical protein